MDQFVALHGDKFSSRRQVTTLYTLRILLEKSQREIWQMEEISKTYSVGLDPGEQVEFKAFRLSSAVETNPLLY